MRRLLAAVAASILIAAMKVPSYAVFTTVSSGTYTASQSFVGSGTVFMTVSWSSGSGLIFSGITLGTTKWKAADNYLIISSTMTDSTGGIQIYTNNRNAASYAYTGSTTTSPAGLVNQSTTTQVLPMCWRVVAVSTVCTIVQGTDNKLYDTRFSGQAGQFPCYLWMMDRNTPTIGANLGFSDGMNYAEIRSAMYGIQFAENTFGTAGPTVNVYLGANFANAMTTLSGVTYDTITLTVEAYHQ